MQRKLIIAMVTLVAVVSAQSSHASAAGIFDRYFASSDTGACYGRTYDAAHLTAHPHQKVSRIEIDFKPLTADNRINEADRFELGFALLLKDGQEWFGNQAVCSAKAASIECFLEGDGGLFSLTEAESGGGLRLQTGDYGIALEGSTFVELDGKSGDDRVFLLRPSAAECSAASAYFKDGSVKSDERGGGADEESEDTDSAE